MRIILTITVLFLTIFSYSQKLDVDGDAIINGKISNVTNPVDPQDAATKAYVDMLEATIKNIIGVRDRDNNRYETVTIGTQEWMAENLRVAHYNDGTSIPLVTDGTAWQDSFNAGNPAYTWYDNGVYGTPDYGAPLPLRLATPPTRLNKPKPPAPPIPGKPPKPPEPPDPPAPVLITQSFSSDLHESPT